MVFPGGCALSILGSILTVLLLALVPVSVETDMGAAPPGAVAESEAVQAPAEWVETLDAHEAEWLAHDIISYRKTP
jgi:hypothetical protein